MLVSDPLLRIIKRFEDSRNEHPGGQPVDYFLACKLPQTLMRNHQGRALHADCSSLRNQCVAEPKLVFVGDHLQPSVVADHGCGLALADRVDDHYRARPEFGAGGESFELKIDAVVLAVPRYVQIRQVRMNVARSTVAHLAATGAEQQVIARMVSLASKPCSLGS